MRNKRLLILTVMLLMVFVRKVMCDSTECSLFALLILV